ncbi:MAG: hypothetical protein AAGC67_07550 [Myxococcota bacterium]
MSRPDSLRLPLRLGALLLAVACLGSECPPRNAPSGFLDPFPNFFAQIQEFATFVDEGADGSLEAPPVPQSVVGGASNPGVLGTSTVSQSVSIAASADSDSILAHCEHTLVPGTSETGCVGTLRGTFVVAEPGVAVFTAQAVAWIQPDLSSEVSSQIRIDCGDDEAEFSLSLDPSDPVAVAAADVRLGVEEGQVCLVEIELTASVTTVALAAATEVRQTVSVSAATTEGVQCTRSSQCPAEVPICDADGRCNTGDEGSPATVTRLHCVTPFVSTFFGCTNAQSGSPCSAADECASGYTCNAFDVCEGAIPCASAGDCPGSVPTCTELGFCSGRGVQGDACVFTSACQQGLLCRSNQCTVILQQGEACPQPAASCDGGLLCDPDTDTCEQLRPPGSSCSANIQCADVPPTFYTCTLGTCSAVSMTGGQCDDDDDCSFTTCNTSTNVCN